MKPFLTALVFITSSVTAIAQLDKGTWLVGGTGNFSSNDVYYNYRIPNTTQKGTSVKIELSPKIGYFFKDKLVVGLKPSVSFERGKGGDVIDSNGIIIASGGISKLHRLDIGPFVRYYFLPKDKNVNIFSELSYLYGTDLGFKVRRSTVLIEAGSEFFFNSSVGLEFTIGYKYKTQTEELPNSYKLIQNSIQIGIGFNFHLLK